MRMTRSGPSQRIAAALALAALVLQPLRARAGDATVAEALFREGRELMQAGDLARACPKLKESYTQDPATGTLLALALCEEAAGRFSSAWASFNGVVDRARKEADTARAEAAQRHATALEPRLSKLTFEVPPELAKLPGFQLTRDGVPVPEAVWGSAIPTDPGSHIVVATADGKTSFRSEVTLGAEADAQTVRVPMLQDDGTQRSATGAQPQAPLVASSSDMGASKPRWNTLQISGLAVGGLGVLGLGAGVVFGLRAKGLDDDSKADGHCDTTGCDDKGLGLNEDARSAGNLSTVFFVAGGALVAGGITLYFVGATREKAAVGITPFFSSRHASVTLHGGF
jgi:hypothetical protein